jgi:hypothetical protein
VTPEELQELEELEELERLEVQYAQPPKADTTPYKYKPQPLMTRGGPLTRLNEQGEVSTVDMTPPEMQQAAKSGVDIDARLPNMESFKAGFASNPAEKDAFISTYIAGRYGEDAITRVGPESGQLEYFNPETQRWSLAETTAMEAVPHIPEMILSTGGAIAGGAAGSAGGPVGTAAGAAGGAGIGHSIGSYMRMKVGEQFGLNESANNLRTAGIEGAETAAFDLGASALYGAGRGIKAVIWGKQVLKPEEARELLNAQRRADATIAEVNRQAPGLTGELFRPWTASVAPETTGGRKLLSAAVKLSSDEDIGPLIAKDIERNESALAMYADNTMLPARMGLEAPHQGAQPLKAAVEGERIGATSGLAAGKANAEDAAAASLGQMGPQNPAQAGQGLRTSIAEKYQAARKAKNDAYAMYQHEAGYNGSGVSTHNVPVSREVLAQQKALKAQIKRIPIKAIGQEKKALLLRLQEGKTINLADLDESIKWLRAVERRAKKGQLSIPMSEIEASRLHKSLSKMREDYLDGAAPEAREALERAEQAAFEEANTFKYGMTRNLLVKEGGDYKLTDAKVITAILKNKDPAAAQEISEILGSDPNAKLAAQNYMFSLYRRMVTNNPERTSIVFKKHKAFMDNYGPVIDEFFEPSQRQRLRELGGFAETIAKNSENLKTINTLWNKSFKGKIDRMSAEALVDRVFTKSLSNDEVRNIASIAARYSPEVLNSWRAGVADKLRERLFKDGLVNGTALGKLTGDLDTMLKLRTIFGPRYIKNLETLKEAGDIIRRVPADINLPNKNTFWTDVARAWYAPPLSREGRIVTMFQGTRGRSYANKIYRALSDPAELERLATRTERTIRNLTGINAAATAAQELQSD